jgi:hypothetical protein
VIVFLLLINSIFSNAYCPQGPQLSSFDKSILFFYYIVRKIRLIMGIYYKVKCKNVYFNTEPRNPNTLKIYHEIRASHHMPPTMSYLTFYQKAYCNSIQSTHCQEYSVYEVPL